MAKKDWMVRESDLDNRQWNVLNAMLDKSLIVTGCPGSGKSVLAYLKAQRILTERKNETFKVIVFTNTLRDFMRSGENGIGRNVTNHFIWKYTYVNDQWIPRDTLSKADYIIVDEIQDFTKEEIMDFINCANKNIFFFGDMAQSIFEGVPYYKNIPKHTLEIDKIPELLTQCGKKYTSENLFYNYRLPIPVARFVQNIGIGLEPLDESKYKSLENVLPKLVQYPDLEAQIKAIAERIKNIPSKGEIAILVNNNSSVNTISSLLNQIGINHEIKLNSNNSRYSINFSSNLPKLMTYHSSKGLQFETVFIPNISDSQFDNGSAQKSLYVAMTRTYRNLFVFYSGTMPQKIQNSISPELYQTTLVDNNIEDI